MPDPVGLVCLLILDGCESPRVPDFCDNGSGATCAERVMNILSSCAAGETGGNGIELDNCRNSVVTNINELLVNVCQWGVVANAFAAQCTDAVLSSVDTLVQSLCEGRDALECAATLDNYVAAIEACVPNMGSIALTTLLTSLVQDPLSCFPFGGGFLTEDDRFLLVSLEVAEFGGAYVDDVTDTLFLWLTDQTLDAESRARAALVREFGDLMDRSNVTTLSANFSFTELYMMRRLLDEGVFDIPEVVFTDIDDTRNRLTVGATDLARAQPAVQIHMTTAGIAPEMVEFEVSSEFVTTSSVRDFHRPVLGGLLIQYAHSYVSRFSNCSLGWVADRVATGTRGFVMNSHCTPVRGAIDGGTSSEIWQPQVDAWQNQNGIGYETLDPPFFTRTSNSACPRKAQCRYSDAAFVSPTLDSSQYTRGGVAWAALGSSTWNGTLLKITAEATAACCVSVLKVGSTTGRTQGKVTKGCINAKQDGGYLLLCQKMADYWSDSGDSGGPVLAQGSTSERSLYGIHWGRTNNGNRAIFSGIGGVQRDLGSLNSCVVTTAC